MFRKQLFPAYARGGNAATVTRLAIHPKPKTFQDTCKKKHTKSPKSVRSYRETLKLITVKQEGKVETHT